MTSQAQLDANRENARLSTGPTSSAGKAASAQNARTHGFSSQITVVPDSFHGSLRSQIQPEGPIEEFLFRRILHASWNVEMIDEAQSTLFPDPLAMYCNDENEKQLNRFARYRTMHMRLYHQAMRSLQYEQTQRGLRSAAPAELAKQAPPQANLSKISEFAKRSQIRERLSTLSPEWQDQLAEMEIQTDFLNAKYRAAKRADPL